MSVVATVGDPARIVAHAGFEPVDDGVAEIAFEVAESLRGRGLATLLMAQLAARAREQGSRRSWRGATRQPAHARVFRESGFPMQVRRAPDDLRIELTTGLTRETLEHTRTESAWLPRQCATSSSPPRSPWSAHRATRQRRRTDPSQPAELRVRGPGVCGEPPRTASSGTRRPPVSRRPTGGAGARRRRNARRRRAQRARDCALKGVKALLVLSGGFAEMGPEGERRQDALVATCRAAGMRLVGPNCLGVIGGAGRVNATFAHRRLPRGGSACCRRARVGLALMEQAATLGLGLSSFVSIGNRPDVSANDVLEYWQDDPSTDIVLLYLESFGNPRNFAR